MIQKVRTSLIANEAIDGNNMGVRAVSANNIAPGAITNTKLAEPNALEDLFLMGGL